MRELPDLSAEEVRVLGALLEKERAVPDVYPMSVNGLVSACNQTTNRDPVVRYDEATVDRALDGLRAKELSRRLGGGRVIKHKQVITETYALAPAEAAVLCVLLLRGPQTVGELKARTERLHDFASLDGVADALAGLAVPTDDRPALVERLDRRPGQKDARWVARLGPRGAEERAGEGRDEGWSAAGTDGGGPGATVGASFGASDGPEGPEGPELAGVRADLDALRAAHEELRLSFEQLRASFEALRAELGGE